MINHQDIILFHKDNKYYGYTTYADVLKDKTKYDDFIYENSLQISVLPFSPTGIDTSPKAVQYGKAIDFLLFRTGVNLADNIRSKLYKCINLKYENLIQLIFKISDEVLKIYTRSCKEKHFVDISRYTDILNNNIVAILEQVEVG